MDTVRFDTLARSLAVAGSRRRALASALGGALGLLGLAVPDATDAGGKCKPTCNQCQTCKKGKCRKTKHGKKCSKGKCQAKADGTGCSSGTCQSGSCSGGGGDTVPPKTTAACGFNGESGGFTGDRRYAQTFPAPGSGPLTTATIGLRSNPAAFSLTFEIRAVDQFGLPANTALASTTVIDIPLTTFNPIARTVSATFLSPATLVLGQPYALVVTGPANTNYAIHSNNGERGVDFCINGKAFRDDEATNDFQELSSGFADMVYTVTVG